MAKIFFQDPLKSVQKVSSFLGCSHSRAFCEEVVRLTSVENMKHVEQQMMDVNGSRDIWKNGQSGYVNSGKNTTDTKGNAKVDLFEYKVDKAHPEGVYQYDLMHNIESMYTCCWSSITLP